MISQYIIYINKKKAIQYESHKKGEHFMSDKNEIEFDELSENKKQEFEKIVGNHIDSLQSIKLFIENNNLNFDDTWNIIINEYLSKK